MGVIVRNRLYERLDDVRWRIRYWWMDTDAGNRTRVACICLAALVAIVQVIRVTVATVLPHATDEPVRAIYPWVVQLIIAIVSAIISYAMRPKPQGVSQSQQEMPTVDDGQSIPEAYGDVWIDEEFIAAQKVIAVEPIKKGGKK